MRYLIAVLLIVVLTIAGAVALFGGGKSSTPAKSARVTKLANYAGNNSASVSWTIQGRLVGEDQRKAIRITVSDSKRSVELLNNYEERVERSQDYSNSSVAFASFARALDNNNFGRERIVKQADDRGVCPLGNVYIYRLTNNGEEVMRTWSDNCSTSDGPFGGNPYASVIAQLFRAQITDYSKFTAGIQL